MKKWIMGLVAVAGCGSMALAQQTDNALVEKYRSILASGGTQALIQAVSGSLMEAVKEGPSTAAPAPAAAPLTPAKTWADSTKLTGDVRFREELRQDHKKNPVGQPGDTVDYDRLRVRLGLESQVNDNVKVGIRVTTDGYKAGTGTSAGTPGGDPQSGNQDLTQAASKKMIFLDLGYIDWNLFGPDNSELHAVLGKMNNPFITMNDDLVWDPDTTPEGVALKGNLDLSPVTLLGNLGWLILNNQDSASVKHDQVDLYAAQGALQYEFCPEAKLTLGVSDYYFQGIKNFAPSLADVTVSSGGTTSYGNDLTGAGGGYLYGYDVVQPFASLDLFPTVFDSILPVSLYGQKADNVLAQHLGEGYMGGITVGKAKLPQTWEVGASYSRLQRDATLGLWTDSDRWGGGTDGDGYKFYVKYVILKNLYTQITYYNDRKAIDAANKGTIYDRYAFDLVASF